MRNTDIPSMLQYVLGEQGRDQLAPEETALMQASAGLPVMVAGGPDDVNKRTWLQKVFGTNREGVNQPVQSPQDAARPVEGLIGPGSISDQIRKRREAADQSGREVSVLPSDMVYAQNDSGTRSDASSGDPYSGVSIQTRSAMHDLGKGDPTGEFSDAIIGKPAAVAPGGYAARTSVRGAQTSKQEDQLVRMLMNSQGMNEKDARARAKAIR